MFCTFDERFGAFAVTPVENLFIDEYMLRAPGDYVRVYLYGLRMCWNPESGFSLASMARALGMDEAAVTDAFAYWERQGVLRRVQDSPMRVEYFHLMDALLARKDEQSEVYHYQEFNQSLQQMFGDKLLHPQDYQRAYDWIEVLGIRPEVILLMVQHSMAVKKSRVTMSYLDKVAKSWAEKGITTLPAARELVEKSAPGRGGAERVLREIGVNRAPTADEARLYEKWTSELGFTHEAILAALPRLSSIQNPNFTYIDRMLAGLWKEGVRTASEIAQSRAARGERVARLREVCRALGDAAASPTDAMRSQYELWLYWGFTHEAVVLAAKSAHAAGGRLFADVDRALSGLRERGLFSPEDIERSAWEDARLTQAMAGILAAMGVDRPVSAADLRLYAQWQSEGVSDELLMCAAKRSHGAKNPLAYAQRVVAAWREQGVTTPEEAEKLHPPQPGSAAQSASVPARPGKEVAEHRYGQRTYSDSEFDSVFDAPEQAAETTGEHRNEA